MSRISSVFGGNRKALIGYITTGHPSLETTPVIAQALSDSGCDIIELGIPFSDPVGDGPTIQRSSFLALQNGATPSYCLETASALRKKVDTPLVFMTYYNPVLCYGLKSFCHECRERGVDGLIIPDAPPEECGELESLARENGLDLIYLLAPTSNETRIKTVAARSTGFIYMVSLTGVTGTRDELPIEIEDFVDNVRKSTDKPLCVGFGVSTPDQAKRVASIADGVIIGSRIIQLIEEDASLELLKTFVRQIRQELDALKPTGKF
jgi:tryptophan synthase alpha chain